MTVISNTTVLSNFASIYQLDVLRQLFGTIYISTEVYEEIQHGLDENYEFYNVIEGLIRPPNQSGWLAMTSMVDDQEINLFSQMPARLHRGETSCIAIAKRRDWLLLTDDRAAREYAIKLDIHI